MSRSQSVWIAAILLGCSGGESEAPDVSNGVRDSSGVVILQSEDAEPLKLTLADSPAVRIGTVDGDERYQLHEVSGVRVLSDGSILVLNAGTHEIHRYSSDGEWLSTSGRRGSGPGELQIPVSLTPALSDSSLVLDFGVRGFHVVDPAGRIVRSQVVEPVPSGFLGLLDSTTAVLAAPSVHPGVYDQIVTAEVAVTAVDLRNSTTDTLTTLTGFQQYSYTHGELVRSVSVPFSSIPAVGVRYGEVYVADGRTPEIYVYARNGQLVRIIRLPLQPVRVEQAEWESTTSALLESRVRSGRGESRLAPWEVERQTEIYGSMIKPEMKPFFDRIYVSSQDTVWLREYQTLGQPQKWLGIDSEGRLAVTIEVPSRLLVRDITADRVLGQEVDSMGVEYIMHYPTRMTQ